MENSICKRCGNIVYNISEKHYICHRCIDEKISIYYNRQFVKNIIKNHIKDEKKHFYNLTKQFVKKYIKAWYKENN